MGMNSTAMRASIKRGEDDPRTGSEKSIFGKIAGMGEAKSPASPAPAPAQRSGLYDAPAKSNFEEEIKKRKRQPAGGSPIGGGTDAGYGGSTKLG